MKNSLLALFVIILNSTVAWGADDDKAFFMTTQSATALSVVSARQKALIFARNTLATMVNGKVINITKSYIDSYTETDKTADEFLTETKTTASMLLQDVSVADETVVEEKKGKYTVYITLKLKKTKVFDALCKRLSENKITKESFKKDGFTDLWKKENN